MNSMLSTEISRVTQTLTLSVFSIGPVSIETRVNFIRLKVCHKTQVR
jgi:hypothetical protein